jgi:hypothetical protein
MSTWKRKTRHGRSHNTLTLGRRRAKETRSKKGTKEYIGQKPYERNIMGKEQEQIDINKDTKKFLPPLN